MVPWPGGCFISFKKRERHIFVPVDLIDLPTISSPTMIFNKSPADSSIETVVESIGSSCEWGAC